MAYAALPACVVPPHVCSDKECHVLLDKMLSELDPKDAAKLGDLHTIIDNMCVTKRHFVRPVSEVLKGDSESERAKIYAKCSINMAKQATQRALDQVGATPKDIDAIVAVACTGFLFPSLAAHLIEQMGFDVNCRTYPVAQWGCAGGGGGLSLAATHCAANPTHNVLFVCVETCSLLYRKAVMTKPTMICNMLFGDAATGQIVMGRKSSLLGTSTAWPRDALLSLHHSGSFRVPNSTGFMRYDTEDDGWHFMLTKDVPGAMEFVVPALKKWVTDTCTQDPIDEKLEFLAHTGGPRVLRDLMRYWFNDDPDATPSEKEAMEESHKSPMIKMAASLLSKMRVPHEEKVHHCMTGLSAFGNIASCALLVSIRLRMLEVEAALTAAKGGPGVESVPVIVVGCGPGMLAEYLYAHLAPATEHPHLPADIVKTAPAAAVGHERVLKLPSPLAPEPVAHISQVFSVTVVGGGPSGAVLANLLCRTLPKDSPPVAIVEKRMNIYPLPRADHIDSQSLRILLEAGLPSSYIDAMTPVLAKQFVLPNGYAGEGKGEGRLFAHMDATQCRALLSDGGVAPSCLFDQPALEEELWKQLDVHQAAGRLIVLRGFEFDTCVMKDDIEDEGGSVPIEVCLRHVKSQTLYGLRTSFIVGCDGAKSPVRRAVEASDAAKRGVAMDEAPTPLPRPPMMEFDRSTNLMVTDVLAKAPGALDALPNIVTQTFLPESNGEPPRHFAIIPNLEEGVCRFVWSITPRDQAMNAKLAASLQGYGMADKKSGKDDSLDNYIKSLASSWMQSAFGMKPPAAGREGTDAALNVEFIKCQAYTVDAHNHTKWTAAGGRILFAGDAAHTMWPYMGQGLCAGIRDAHAIAWRLALITETNATGTPQARELMRQFMLERRDHVDGVLEGSAKVRLNGVSVMKRLTSGEPDLPPTEHAYGRMPAMCVSDMQLAFKSSDDVCLGQLFPRVLVAPEDKTGGIVDTTTGAIVSGVTTLFTNPTQLLFSPAPVAKESSTGGVWTDYMTAVPPGAVGAFVVWTKSGEAEAAALEGALKLRASDTKLPPIFVRSIALDRIVTRDDTTHAAGRLANLFADGTGLVVMRPDSYVISRVRGSGATPSALAERVIPAVRQQLALSKM